MSHLVVDRVLSSHKTHQSSQILRIAPNWDTSVQLPEWLASDNRSVSKNRLVWEAEFVLRKLAILPE
jgi:hypothetical protein